MNKAKINLGFKISLQLFLLTLILILIDAVKLININYYLKIEYTIIVPIALFTIFFYLKYEDSKTINKYVDYIFIISIITLLLTSIYKIYATQKTLYLINVYLSFFLGIILLLKNKDFNKDILKKLQTTNSKKHYIFLVLILLFFLGLYIYHLQTIKYIDTDESRLMFDAKQISTGKTPYVDFQARAPLLIYFLSIFTSIFTNSLNTFYIISIITNITSILLLYILTKQLFNEKIAIYTAITFGLAPIMVFLLWLKTQTFLIPVILISYILFDRALTKKSKTYYATSILILLLAMFIRETSIIYFAGLFGLILYRNNDKKQIYHSTLNLIYSAFFVLFAYLIINNTFFIYGNFTISNNLQNFFKLQLDEDSSQRLTHLPDYISYFYIFLFTISFGLVAKTKYYILKNYKKLNHKSFSLLFPYFPLLALTVIYTFNAYRLGFWPQYFMEFAPYFCLVIGITIYYMTEKTTNKYTKYLTLSLLLILVIFSSYNGALGIKMYKGAINKEGTIELSNDIKTITDKNDTIFGGSPIYAYLSDREHLMNLSHEYYDENYVKIVTQNAIKNPPKIIILDDRISKYYIPDPNFKKLFNTKYILYKKYNASDYNRTWSASVYLLNESNTK